MKDSVQALSYGLARADMLWRMPALASTALKELLPYWLPRSL